MPRLAGFPMYDFPEIRTATDAFWQAFSDELHTRGITDRPSSLTRATDLPAFWRNDDLLIGQTCGYPMMIGMCGKARYIASPCYTTPHSHGAFHKSLIISRKGGPIRTLADAHHKICAINMADSNTGMNVLRLEIAKLKPHGTFFSRVYETLAHRKSMHAVAQGDADIAAIDCVTFAHVERFDPQLIAQLSIIAETEETPTLPFITSSKTDDATLAHLRAALLAVTAAPHHRAICDRLMLQSVEILGADAYHRVREIEDRAIMLGYPQLV